MLTNCKIENYLIIITRHICHNDDLVHVKVGDRDYIDLHRLYKFKILRMCLNVAFCLLRKEIGRKGIRRGRKKKRES